MSLADAIALGAVIAVESWSVILWSLLVSTLIALGSGGDYIPFRGGRVDATKPGPPGVPEPADTLEKHTRDFSRLGFTPKEMIQVKPISFCVHESRFTLTAAYRVWSHPGWRTAEVLPGHRERCTDCQQYIGKQSVRYYFCRIR